MAKDKSQVEAVLPPPIVEAKAEATVPVSVADQITKLQRELRTVRAEIAAKTERRNVLEESLSKLHAQVGLERKRGEFLQKLNDAEREALNNKVVK